VREPAFAARGVIEANDARTLAEKILAMDENAYRAAFRGSAMKRAKLAGLQRNARVVLGNVGTNDAP
jgi:epoxyqueuosine reductase QueG